MSLPPTQAIVQAILAVILGPIAGDVFRLQTSLSPSAARAIVAGWAPEDEQRFRWHFYLDGLYPLLYALLMRRRARALPVEGAGGRAQPGRTGRARAQ